MGREERSETWEGKGKKWPSKRLTFSHHPPQRRRRSLSCETVRAGSVDVERALAQRAQRERVRTSLVLGTSDARSMEGRGVEHCVYSYCEETQSRACNREGCTVRHEKITHWRTVFPMGTHGCPWVLWKAPRPAPPHPVAHPRSALSQLITTRPKLVCNRADPCGADHR